MKEKIRKEGKQNIPILLLGLVILLVFLYGCYRIETTNSFLSQDELTGRYLQDREAKNISYMALAILCIYALIMTQFLQEKEGKIKVENLFLVTVPIFCILLALAMPMSKGHDETIHGLRVYEYAEGKWISNGETAYLEEGVANALDNKQTYQALLQPEKTYSTKTDKIEWGYRIAAYSPINYLPQVVSITIARMVTSNSMVHLYLARLANIATCMFLLYIAIKITPYGKNLLFLLSFIPIAVEGFATISADGMIIAASFLWIAYLLKLREEREKKLRKKEFILLSILAVVIALSKTIYIVLLPLLCFIPNEKFSSKKVKIGFIIMICFISAILDMGWYIIGVQKDTLFVESGNDPIGSLISHPIGYLEKCLYTMAVNLPRYIEEAFGGKLEWSEKITVPFFPILLGISSILLSTTGEKEIIWKNWEKILLTIVIISAIFLIFTSMYISWSKTEIITIEGIQGRYFLPIMPLIFLLLGRKFLEDSKTAKNIATLGVIMQIVVILELILFHI